MADLPKKPAEGAAPLMVRAGSSLKWSAMAELGSKAFSPLVLVILARLLTPHEFGLVAVATLGVTFVQMLWEGGLGRALIQLDEKHLEAANVVFWINLVLAALAFAGLQAFAAPIAHFLGDQAAAPVLRVLGLQVIITAVGAVQQSLLTRELNFRKLFRIRIVSTLGPGLVSIPLAVSGLGVWALVAGTLAGQTAAVALLWAGSSWRPSLSFDPSLARRLAGFGIWVALESFGAWLLTSGDNLVVGKNLGVHDLGIYRTGSALVTVIFATLLSPLLPVAYPTFCRLQDNPERLREVFMALNRLLVTAAVAISCGLALVAPTLAVVIFSKKWEGLGWVIQLLAAMNGVAWIVGLNAELYRAMGRPDINTKLMYLQLLYYVPAYWFAAQKGLLVFCVVRAAVAMVSLPLHVFFAGLVLQLKWTYLWPLLRQPLLGALGMAVAVLAVQHGWPGSLEWARLAAMVAVGAVSFFLTVHLTNRRFFAGLRSFWAQKHRL